MTARLFSKTGKTRGLELELETRGEVLIGRDPKCDLVIEHRLMSSRHARIFYDGDARRFMVEDLASLNGTALDGDRVANVEPLSHLNVLTFAGTYDFFFFDAERLAQRHPDSTSARPSIAQEARPAESVGVPPSSSDDATPDDTSPDDTMSEDATSDEVTSIEHDPIAMPDFLARRADAMSLEPSAESSIHPSEITSVELDPIAVPSFLARRADQAQDDDSASEAAEGSEEAAAKNEPTLHEKLPVAMPGSLAQRSDEVAEVDAMRRPSVQKHETVDLAQIEDLIAEEASGASEHDVEPLLGLHLIVTEPGGQVRHYPLAEGENLVGRGAGADVPLRYPDLSRRHAKITVTGNTLRVQDLGSRNRTFVDDQQIDPESTVEVEPGARLRFGSVEARLAKLDSQP